MTKLPPYRFYELRRDGVIIEKAFLCPVCDFPTISQPEAYEICDLCSWEDDGFDEGGPNGDYTLEEARANFINNFSMYRATHEISPQFRKASRPTRVVEIELISGTRARKVAKMKILTAFMQEPDLDKRGILYQSYLECA